MNIGNIKWVKIIKYGKLAILQNPKAIFKKKRNLKFQFDMFHGCGVIDKAINLLNNEDKNEFSKFIIKESLTVIVINLFESSSNLVEFICILSRSYDLSL